MEKLIYLDHNATTFAHPEVLKKLQYWGEMGGNPSSIHWAGRGPKAILRQTRRVFAEKLGLDPLEVIFTSGGSESNNLALQGLWHSTRKLFPDKKKILISAVEHPSVSSTVQQLKLLGAVVETFGVNHKGEVDWAEVSGKLDSTTLLVSCMLVNNETGHVYPVESLCEKAHAVGAFFHTDAVQGLGKMPLQLRKWGVDFASFSGHKFYCLKGVGVLYCKKGTPLNPVICGGGQERGRRAGTENTLAIASLGEMMNRYEEVLSYYQSSVSELRDVFESKVLELIPSVSVTGQEGVRVPHVTNLVLKDVGGESLLLNLDLEGFAVSSGAACSSGSSSPSPVLISMGLSQEEAQSSLRVSFGLFNTLADVEHFVKTLEQVVLRQRAINLAETLKDVIV